MPALTIPIGPDGPIGQIGIAVSGPRQAAMHVAGLAIPVPQVIFGLIDTGASCTCVDKTVIAKLGLQPTGIVSIHTPSTGMIPHRAKQFDVALAIAMDNQQPHLMSMVIPVIESDFSLQPYDALIGRDVLSRGLLIYNGVTRVATLSF